MGRERYVLGDFHPDFCRTGVADSGARMSRQARFLREGVEDHSFWKKPKGKRG